VRQDYDRTTVEDLAQALIDHLGKPVHYADVPRDGTERAARMLSELL
jgi:hypothetical protein